MKSKAQDRKLWTTALKMLQGRTSKEEEVYFK